MPSLTDMTGLAGVASATAAAALLLPGIARLSRTYRAILMGTVLVLALIPFGELPLAAYLRGATGDLSITTLVLLWGALSKPWGSTPDHKPRQALLLLVALTSLVFYSLALGISLLDPYRMGYGEPLFVAALLLIALATWFLKSSLITLCIALATLAWAIGWYESSNLWDYLLDPFVSIYALGAIAIQAAKRLMDQQRGAPHQS